MQYFCVEYDECGFSDQSFDSNKYEDLICPSCYSPLIVYPIGVSPPWSRETSALTSASSEELIPGALVDK